MVHEEVELASLFTWIGSPLLAVHSPQWQPLKIEGYVAGAPLVARLKLAVSSDQAVPPE